jgi:hypothetical protein
LFRRRKIIGDELVEWLLRERILQLPVYATVPARSAAVRDVDPTRRPEMQNHVSALAAMHLLASSCIAIRIRA